MQYHDEDDYDPDEKPVLNDWKDAKAKDSGARAVVMAVATIVLLIAGMVYAIWWVGENQAIEAYQYNDVERIVQSHPELGDQVEAALEDGVIRRGEYKAIEAAELKLDVRQLKKTIHGEDQ
jgi:hypothetical protein